MFEVVLKWPLDVCPNPEERFSTAQRGEGYRQRQCVGLIRGRGKTIW